MATDVRLKEELPAITDARPSMQPVALASGRLPALPAAARSGQILLILFSLACVLAALGILWLGRRISPRRPTTDDRRPATGTPTIENHLPHLCGGASVTARVEAAHD